MDKALKESSESSETQSSDEEHLVPILPVISGYEVHESIGVGTFSGVFLATDLSNGERYALKLFEERYTEKALTEIAICKRIRSTGAKESNFFVKLISSSVEEKPAYLFYELLGIDLLRLGVWESLGPILTYDKLKHIFYQICLGMKFLHNLNIVHTDLRPENVMFSKFDPRNERCVRTESGRIVMDNSEIKIIDLGNATFSPTPLTGRATAMPYRAPEVALGVTWYKAIDVWSCACVIFEIASRKPLFRDVSDLGLLASQFSLFPDTVPEGVYEKSPTIQNNACEFGTLLAGKTPIEFGSTLNIRGLGDSALQDLLSKMLYVDHYKRLTFQQALEHPYFEGVELFSDSN